MVSPLTCKGSSGAPIFQLPISHGTDGRWSFALHFAEKFIRILKSLSEIYNSCDDIAVHGNIHPTGCVILFDIGASYTINFARTYGVWSNFVSCRVQCHAHNMGIQYSFSVFHQYPLKLSLISILIVVATVYDTII